MKVGSDGYASRARRRSALTMHQTACARKVGPADQSIRSGQVLHGQQQAQQSLAIGMQLVDGIVLISFHTTSVVVMWLGVRVLLVQRPVLSRGFLAKIPIPTPLKQIKQIVRPPPHQRQHW
jgi:hypothetical protein